MVNIYIIFIHLGRRDSLRKNGVVFCEGDLTLQESAPVNGAVVSGGDITMTDSAQIVQNKNLLPLNPFHTQSRILPNLIF